MYYHFEEKVDMRSLVNKEPDWVPVYGDSKYEIRGRSRSDCLPHHPIMMRVDQGLVQVQDQDLSLDNAQPMTRKRREWRYVITNRLVLNYLKQLWCMCV